MVKLDLCPSVLVKCRMPFFPLLVIYFLWRILFLILAHPLNLVIYAEEELYRGWIGREIAEGLKLPFYSYRADDYSGGSLLIGALASGLFKLLGTTLFALKAVPVLLFAGALAAWYFWLSRYYGRRFASLYALLLIFSPYLFTRFSLTTLGDHPETIFFTAVSLYCFFKTLDVPKPRWIYPALLGLLSGIGLWMAYIYAITLLTIFVYWFLRDRKFFCRRTFWTAAGFFCLGFSPWVYGNLMSSFQGLTIQGMGFFDIFHWKFFLKRILSFRTSAPYLLFAVHQIPSVVPEFPPVPVMRFYRMMFLVPVLLWGWNCLKSRPDFRKVLSGHSPAHFAMLYLSVFLLVCQATEYREIRYFIPVQPFVFFLAFFALDRFLQKFRPEIQKGFTAFYIGILITVSCFLHVRTFYPEYAGMVFRIKPYAMDWFLLSPACHTPEKCLQTYRTFKFKDQLDPRDLFILKSGVAQKLLEEMPFQDPPEELKALKQRVPDELHFLLHYYFGYETFARNHEDLRKTFLILRDVNFGDGDGFYWAALGVFRFPLPPPKESPDLNEAKSLMVLMPAEVHPVLWRQAGFQWMEYTHQNSRNFDRLIIRALQKSWELPEEYQIYFLEGVGRYFYLDWYLKPYQKLFPLDFLYGLPDRLVRAIARGMGFGQAENQNLFADVFKRMIEKRLPPDFKRDFAEGFETGSVFVRQFDAGIDESISKYS